VVAQGPEEVAADDAAQGDAAQGDAAPSQYVETQDPEWYAEQASELRSELERRQARLQRYRQAIEDARELKTTTGGINLAQGDIAITPEDGIESLRWRIREIQSDLDDLEDLARHNDIPPGTLRGL
jgi:prefoldin subunit 5